MNPVAAIYTELLAAGVHTVVLAPGSRSAPLAYGAAELEEAGAITLRVETDERAAAFTALGEAKATARPVAVITTSGTAVANLHPAMAEAFHSAIPLIALTADRPAALRGTGANQTTWQPGMLGPALAGEIDLAAKDLDSGQLRMALAKAAFGPVHVNVSFAEPLHPAGPVFTEIPQACSPPPVAEEPAGEDLDERRTVIIAGPRSPLAPRRAMPAGIPIFAEPAADERSLPQAVPASRIVAETMWPDIERVIISGHPTLSRPITRLMSRDDIEVLALDDMPGPTNPGRVATIIGAMPTLAPNEEFLNRCLAVGRAAVEAGRTEARRRFDPIGAAGVVAEADGEWFLGASNVIRDVDLLAGSPAATFHASRGLAGIDGTIATARGMARSGPLRCAMGDLTFFHDASSLLPTWGQVEPELDLLVIDDGGGGIFASLEHGKERYAGVFDRVFRTRRCGDITGLARAAGWQAEIVASAEELAEVLATPPAHRLILASFDEDTQAVRARRSRLVEVMSEAAAATPASSRS